MKDRPWIIDVGACNGSEGLKLKRLLKAQNPRVLYIEPDPDAFSGIALEEGDVKLEVAAASHDGTIPFFFYQPGTHSVLQTNLESIQQFRDGFTGLPARADDWTAQKTLEVPCRRLDSLIREHGIERVRLLKIDAQGYDLEIIKSLGAEIGRVEELICEVQISQLPYRDASKKEEIIEHLHSKGFLFVKQESQTYGQELNLYFRRPSLLGGIDREPLVSILTPSYNSAAYIEKCIQSVLSQNYPWIEIIIQDGGSKDGTVDILERYSDRISWRSEKDAGQSDGLNRALQRCRGDIIGVLNADDEYLPHAALWAVEELARRPEAAAVYGRQHNIDADGRLIDTSEGPDPYDFLRIFACEAVIPAQAAFFRRSALESVGFQVDVTRDTCPDYELWVRLGLKFPMAYVPEVVARYRQHRDSEGLRQDVIWKMVRSKCEVVERVAGDPRTPPRVRAARKRALSGIHYWSTCHFAMIDGQANRPVILGQLKKSFWIRPHVRPAAAWLLLTLIPALRSAIPDAHIWKLLLRYVREAGRAVDRHLLGGRVYAWIYLPIKKKIRRPVQR